MSNLFGTVNDQDQSLQSKESGNFGLNPGSFVTKLEYNPNGGKDGTQLDCFDITVKIGDKEYRNRLFDVSSIYDRDQGAPRELDMSDPKDEALYMREIKQVQGVITHAVKSTGVTQDQINTAFSQGVSSFVEWGKIMVSLVPDNFESNPIDAFLEYQWSIQDGNDKTYLTLPRNMKGGYFLCPQVAPQGGPWDKVVDSNGLRYVDGAGNEHPFTRKASYMESNKAIQQGVDSPADTAGSAISGVKQKTTW